MSGWGLGILRATNHITKGTKDLIINLRSPGPLAGYHGTHEVSICIPAFRPGPPEARLDSPCAVPGTPTGPRGVRKGDQEVWL